MDASFWHARWQAGEIGFHMARPHPQLCRFWPGVGVAADSDVLVPLCGKSLDMCWLHERGHAVTGVELSQRALDAFVEENQLAVDRVAADYRGKGWHLVCADWFTFQADRPFHAFYDRAALIALPPALRRRYAEHLVSQLAVGAQGLLITLEYPDNQMDGPPFSVTAQEVEHLFAGHSVQPLARTDVLAQEARFRERGLTALEEVVWQIGIR